MKKFKMIEKKDPYENISPNNLIVRRFPDIRIGIKYSISSLISSIAILLIQAFSLIEKFLSQYETVSSILDLIMAIILIVSLPGMFMAIILGIAILIRFIYNLIVKKVIGVDIYNDYITLSGYLCNKIIDPIFEEDYKFDYDEDDYECDEDDNDCECDDEDDYEDNSEHDNFEENGNIITVDFSKRESI